jgi:hypothetical protein
MAQETQNVTQELNETWEKGKSPLEKNNFWKMLTFVSGPHTVSTTQYCDNTTYCIAYPILWQHNILYWLPNIVTTQPEGSMTLTPKPIILPKFEVVRSTFNTHNSGSHLTQPFCVKQWVSSAFCTTLYSSATHTLRSSSHLLSLQVAGFKFFPHQNSAKILLSPVSKILYFKK